MTKNKLTDEFLRRLDGYANTFPMGHAFIRRLMNDDVLWLSTASNAHIYAGSHFLAYLKLHPPASSERSLALHPRFHTQIVQGVVDSSRAVFGGALPNIIHRAAGGTSISWVRSLRNGGYKLFPGTPGAVFDEVYQLMRLVPEIKGKQPDLVPPQEAPHLHQQDTPTPAVNPRWSYPRFLTYQREMRKHAAGWFRQRGDPVSKKYPFILKSRELWPRNIILPEVVSLIRGIKGAREAQRRPFPLHKYIHHGLSSQAMLFNLVGPLLARDDLVVMAETIMGIDMPWGERPTQGYLEFEDREVFNERQPQPTSIDLAMGPFDGPPLLFVEAKLIEQEFGACSVFTAGDCDGRNPARDHEACYLHAIGRSYWPCLESHGFLTGPFLNSPICLLANYYQYFREVLFALEKGGYMAILIDSRNPVFVRDGSGGSRGLIPFLAGFLPEDVRSRVIILTIQQVLQAIESSGRHQDWTPAFRAKYGLTS